MPFMEAFQPTKPTQKKIASILDSLRNGSTIVAACNAAGMNRQHFYDWMNLNGNRKDVDKILDNRISVVEDMLYQNCLKGKEGSIFFFLTRRAGDRWPDQAKFQQQFGDNIKFEIMDYKQAAKVCEEIKKSEDSQRTLPAS